MEELLLKKIASSGIQLENEAVEDFLQEKFPKKKLATIKKQIRFHKKNLIQSFGKPHKALKKLRAEIEKENLDGLIVKTTDENINEYLPMHFQQIEWLTGFTGSVAFVLVLQEKAAIFVDGRYFLQAKKEINPDDYEVIDFTYYNIKAYLKANAKNKQIGIYTKTHSIAEYEKLEEISKNASSHLKLINTDIFDIIWENRPQKPISPIILHEKPFAHFSFLEKLNKIEVKGLDFLILTKTDSISWLCNIRSFDLTYNPIVLSFAILDVKNNKLRLFIDKDKLTQNLIESIDQNISFANIEDFYQNVANLPKDQSIGLAKSANYHIFDLLQNHNIKLINEPVIFAKTVKNKKEISAMRKAHIQDGLAMIEIMHTIKQKVEKNQNPTELEISKIAEEKRKTKDLFFGLSFETIVGINENGAFAHYHPSKETQKTVNADSIVVFDSGGHYKNGTTDITRTLSYKKQSLEFQKHYTLVLKSHIALAMASFPKGTKCKELDKISRSIMQKEGLDYNHGTGHGVGYFLNVHEDPISLNPNSAVPIEQGMYLSNEPGYYKEKRYGIRIENLIITQEKEGKLYFETLSLVPIDTQNVIISMLNKEEINWINNYHIQVYKTLAPYIKDPFLKNFLIESTQAIM